MKLLRIATAVALNTLFGALTVPHAYAAPFGRVIPFTTYQLEQQTIVESLPCKWISMNGWLGPSYGNETYDFLCKGGNWATVSFYLDKANGSPRGLYRVRLYYRAWNDNVHPSAAEAFEAQKYLEYVANRFVPAGYSTQVLQAFWGDAQRSWRNNDVAVSYAMDSSDKKYNVHKLEVVGLASSLTGQGVTIDEGSPAAKGEVPGRAAAAAAAHGGGEVIAGSAPVPLHSGEVIAESAPGGNSAGILISDPLQTTNIANDNLVIRDIVPIRPVTPSDAGLLRRTLPSEPVVPTAVPAKPWAPSATPGSFPDAFRARQMVPLMSSATVPAKAKGTMDKDAPPARASAAELNTAPAPESKAKPRPLPPVSTSLVPDPAALIEGRSRAPSNFDAYNRASDLTKSIEKRAMTEAKQKPIVSAVSSTAAGSKGRVQMVPAGQKEPQYEQQNYAPAPQTYDEDRGQSGATRIGVPAGSARSAAPSGEGLGMTMGGGQTQISEPTRPLPQLKFVPKAEPMRDDGGEVIQFEDEKSGL